MRENIIDLIYHHTPSPEGGPPEVDQVSGCVLYPIGFLFLGFSVDMV